MRTNVTYTVSKAVGAGLAGGIVGAVILGGIAYRMPVNGQPFFVAAAMLMNLSGGTAIVGGWMLHLITGLIVGAIFGVALTKVRMFRVTDVKRGVGWGIGAGILVWVVFFLPMMLSVMGSMIPSGQMPLMIGGSFLGHVIYGLGLGGIAGVALSRTASVSSFKCSTCGATFQSERKFMEHSKTHMATTATQYNCPTCGASFKSQAELMQHADKHKVLTR